MNRLEDEHSLFRLTLVGSIDYRIIYEMNELKEMNEGIYLAVIELSEQSFKTVLSSVQSGESIKWENDKYTEPSWLQTPSTEIDVSIFNYNPVVSFPKSRSIQN